MSTRKKNRPKTFYKTTIDVNDTHLGIWREVAKQLQGRKKTCIKKFHSARREEYWKLDKMTTNVNDTHFGVLRDVTKNCKEEKKRLYQTIINCKKRKHTWKTIENANYMCLGICKEVARHCNEKEKTYQTIVYILHEERT